jgi:DNA-directed RNA polymerase subunit N (RpoN/RPB10)
MLYAKCPTCRQPLCHLQIPFQEAIDGICNNPKLSQEEKDLKEQEVVNSFGLRRYCCTTRLMTYKRLIEIVK